MNGVECLDVGARTCLFRPENRAMCLVNATAREIWQGIAREMPPDEVAAVLAQRHGIAAELVLSDIAALERSWREIGLLGALPRHDRGAPHVREVPKGTAELSACFGTGAGPSVQITVRDARMAGLLGAVLAPLARPAREAASHAIEVGPTGDGLGVWEDGVALALDAPPSLARRLVLGCLLVRAGTRAPVSAIIHGSSLQLGDHTVVLAGGTGSGKSTLLLGLLAAGARYSSDDLTAVGADGLIGGPFPVAVSVKRGSFGIAARLFPELSTLPIHRLGEREARYLDVSDLAAPSLRERVLFVFPRYEAGAALACTPLAADEVLARLIASGTDIVGHRPSMAPLIALVGNASAWEVVHGDLDAAVRAIARLEAGHGR